MNVEPEDLSSSSPIDGTEAASPEMSPALVPLSPTPVSSNSSNLHPQDKIAADSGSLEPGESVLAQPDQNPDQSLPTALVEALLREYQAELPAPSASVQAVVTRIAVEVERVCSKSDRIQTSGDIEGTKTYLAGLRMQRCLNYYRLGSRQGRVELHSHLSTVVYRHIAPPQAQLGFAGRYTAIEDFLQGFYIEALKAFRRENQLPETYQPRTRLELAEYMAFTELYAKRRIALPGARKQQLVVLRAQTHANRQPPEAAIDLDMAMESAKGEEAEMHSRSPMVQQVREQMVSDSIDPTDSVIRDRVIIELIEYLEDQGQENCVKYLVLKLKDCSAPEIDEILELSPRERDYLQQRFKYHVEKFAKSHRWQLVHQWLGADIDQNLGLSQLQWQLFISRLSAEESQLLELKGKQLEDSEIAKLLKCTLKQVQKRWVHLLDLAWQVRNNGSAPDVADA